MDLPRHCKCMWLSKAMFSISSTVHKLSGKTWHKSLPYCVLSFKEVEVQSQCVVGLGFFYVASIKEDVKTESEKKKS